MFKEKLLSILSAMIFIGLLIVSFIFSFYLIIFAVLLGVTVFIITFLRGKWQQLKKPQTTTQSTSTSGRIIDHDDN